MTSDSAFIQKVRKVAGYFFSVFLTVLFLYFAFRNVDIAESLNLISKLSFLWFILFVIVFALSHVLRAIRWKILIKSIKPNAYLLHLLGATMIGYGVNCVVPRLGEIYRPSFLGKWEGISRSSMFGTIIVERVIDLIVLGFSVLLAVHLYSGDLYSEFEWLKATLYLGGISMSGIVLMLILTVKLKSKFYNIILKFVGRFSERIANKLAYIFEMLVSGFSTVKTATDWAKTVFYSIAIMILYGLNAYLAFYVLKMDQMNDVTFEMGWIVMTISAFGVVFPTPGGTGSYHWIVIAILGALGFNQNISGAYALLTHSVSYFSFIFATIFFVMYINHRRKNKFGEKKETFFSVFKTDSSEQ